MIQFFNRPQFPASRTAVARSIRSPWRRFRQLLPLAAVLIMMLAVSVASSHSELTRSEPAAGQALEQPPEQVTAWFSEELDAQASTMEVIVGGSPIGNGEVDLGDLDHLSMMATLPSGSPEGAYTVRWTAVSAEDGDPSSGEFAFTVGSGAAASEAAAQTTGGASPLIIGAILAGALILVAVIVIGVRNRQKVPVES